MMTRIVALLLGLAWLWPVNAAAQYREAFNTPRAKVGDVEIGIWMVYSQVGFIMIAAEKNAAGEWMAIVTSEPYQGLGDLESAVNAAGGVEDWIESQAPVFNAALADRFAEAASESQKSHPEPGGPPLMDKVNKTLKSDFKIVVGPDGIPRLVKK
ncbi:MAG: hypothetical protein FJX59_00015 [Alphaproteobacteria bacterium]|nr:hypothetical protein [Alphaproteobacteria bacterium]